MTSSNLDASSSLRGTNEENINHPVHSISQDISSTYDFAPILSASAVQKQAHKNQGTFALVSPIPTTRIPSPLANNLSPAVIEDIHDYLLGIDKYSDHNAQVYNGNGREVWESWKRAWDIWNNYFIEGRVNELWIRQAYRKYEAWEKYRTRARRGRKRLRRTPKTGPKPPPPNPDDYIGKVHHGPVPDLDPGAGMETDYPSDPDDPSQVKKPPIVEEDGSSGGFFAMRDFEEYDTPDANYLSHEYYDPIENSVWRPRRVGEKSLKIDMDEEINEFLGNTDLEFDGGLDCGRSPYPLLRPLIRYARGVARVEEEQEPRYFLKLKKHWDGLRGTIFNMPTGLSDPPLHSDEWNRSLSDKSMQVEESYINHKVFPLDIRRVAKILPESEQTSDFSKEQDNLERDKDIIIKLPFKKKQKKYRDMLPDDPWWVTEQEREARDVPPRTYPLAVDPKQSRLPFDDRLWQNEVKKDSSYKNQYFVVNLDGRHLMVNGLEIKKGQCAGPLQQFAVIQYEGGGVAFWFGVGGRFYKQAQETNDWTAEWAELRQKNQEWANVGLPAGLVWRHIILAKIRENAEGEGEQEPMWLRWKNVKPVNVTAGRSPDRRHSFNIRAGAVGGSGEQYDDGNTLGPLPFTSLGEELKWVAAQFHFQQLAELPLSASPIIEPTQETARGDLPDGYQAPSDNATDEQRDQIWQGDQAEMLANQREATQPYNRDGAHMNQSGQAYADHVPMNQPETTQAHNRDGEHREQSGQAYADHVPMNQPETTQAYNRDGELREQSGQAYAEQVSTNQTETTEAYNRVAEQKPVTPIAEETGKKRSDANDIFDIPTAKRNRQDYNEEMNHMRMKLIESDQKLRRRKNDRRSTAPKIPHNQGADFHRSSSSAPRIITRAKARLPSQGFDGKYGIPGEAWLRKETGNLRDEDKQALIDRDRVRKRETVSHYSDLSAARRKKRVKPIDTDHREQNRNASTSSTAKPETPAIISRRRHEVEKTLSDQRLAQVATTTTRQAVARAQKALHALQNSSSPVDHAALIRAEATLAQARIAQDKADTAYAHTLSLSQRARSWNLSAAAIKAHFPPADETALLRAIQEEADARLGDQRTRESTPLPQVQYESMESAEMAEEEYIKGLVPHGFKDWEDAVGSLPVAAVVADVDVRWGLPGTWRFGKPVVKTREPGGKVLVSLAL
ncbi:hypothetical protein ACMFMF_008695 [Clarireedia jacksonii]